LSLCWRRTKRRAKRFRFEGDRSALVARRAAFCIKSGRCLDGEPFELPFSCNAYGKPGIPSEIPGSDLRFNASHSGGMALIAITRRREVGIDVEAVRSDIDYLAVAEHAFSERERETLRPLSAGVPHWLARKLSARSFGTGAAFR